MSKFDPDYYSRYRPFYPAELFAELGPLLVRQGFAAPFDIADVGCGTGHSVASLMAAGIPARVMGVDPDPGMLAKARELCPGREFKVGTGEHTGLDACSVDAITVGSAFHWMEALSAREEFLRVLRPRGAILVYEYQFPKSQGNAPLNEWIRREFNLRWKAPMQKPRGDFASVTSCFRADGRVRVVSDRKVPMVLELRAEELTGLILSQSRVLHFEATLAGEQDREEFRRGLATEIAARTGGQPDRFDFSLQCAHFVKGLT